MSTLTHLQNLVCIAQNDNTTVAVISKLLEGSSKNLEASKKSLHAAIHTIFHTTISANPKALTVFKSKSLRLVLDQPAETDFLTDAVTAVVAVLLDPSQKSIDIDLVPAAADLREGNRFCFVQKRLEEEVGILLALTEYSDKYTFSVSKK